MYINAGLHCSYFSSLFDHLKCIYGCFMKKILKIIIFFNIRTQFDIMVFPYNPRNKGPYFFVEHQIDLKFSENNVMMLKYYKTIPCFSHDEQTARSYGYFFKTLFKKVIFFGLLRVPMMTLPRQPVFLVFTSTFLSFFYQQFRITLSSRTPTFKYNG